MLVTLVSCIRDGKSITTLSLSNTTTHKVTLIPYYNGVVDSSRYKSLLPYDQILIENNFQKGKTKIPVIFWDYFKQLDSLTVIWDDTFNMTHMLSDTFHSSTNFIQFAENRNIGLSASYIQSIKSESKISIEWSVIYNFTEQDYLDATQ